MPISLSLSTSAALRRQHGSPQVSHMCFAPTCRIYVHPFRNSFGLIDFCRLSQDTRLTSDSCSSGWCFAIGFLHRGRFLPRLAPVRADSGLSPHRHTCAAGRTEKRASHAGALSLERCSRRQPACISRVPCRDRARPRRWQPERGSKGQACAGNSEHEP